MGLFYAQNQKIKYQSRQKEKSDLLPAISGFTIETDKIFQGGYLMPFINSKISTPISIEQEQALKTRLGQAISIVPGKSESWLMLGFEPNYNLYFRGSNSEPLAMIEVSVFGGEDATAFSALTAEICNIFHEIMNISPDHVYVKYQTVKYWGWNGDNI